MPFWRVYSDQQYLNEFRWRTAPEALNISRKLFTLKIQPTYFDFWPWLGLATIYVPSGLGKANIVSYKWIGWGLEWILLRKNNPQPAQCDAEIPSLLTVSLRQTVFMAHLITQQNTQKKTSKPFSISNLGESLKTHQKTPRFTANPKVEPKTKRGQRIMSDMVITIEIIIF